MPLPSNSSVAIRNVAVATDFTSCSEHAVEHSLAVARHFGATLHFLHVLRPSKFAFVPEMIPALADAADHDCDQLIDRLSRDHRLDGIDYRRCVEQGEVSEIAGDFVRDRHIDLLILGTHGRGGLPRLLLGSVAQQMFHYVGCPVLTVGPRSPGAGSHLQLRRVLFSTDLSRDSLAAIPWVLTAVEQWHTELDVLHVCKSGNPAHRATMNATVDQLQAELDADSSNNPADDSADHHEATTPHGDVLAGKPAPCVLDFAGRHHEDLIVLGLKPHRALYNGPLWSHAYEIVRQAQCPVLSIRGPQA
jgi:nucleotide-binding universal stress UspA family protein